MAVRRRRAERASQYGEDTYVELQKRLAANVRAQRKALGWTQEQAAHECQMPTRLLQSVESGKVNLTLTTLARLVNGLKVDASELLAR